MWSKTLGPIHGDQSLQRPGDSMLLKLHVAPYALLLEQKLLNEFNRGLY